MSILDEDESNFDKDGGRFIYYSKVINEYLPDAVILVSKCVGIPCSECVGHRHNVRYRCPVCGSPAITSAWSCRECGSVIRSCGGGSISAVGVPKIWLELRAKEDVI